DGADLRGLDEADGAAALQHFRQGGGGHPACGAAPDDEDASEAIVGVRAQNLAPSVSRSSRGTPAMVVGGSSSTPVTLAVPLPVTRGAIVNVAANTKSHGAATEPLITKRCLDTAFEGMNGYCRMVASSKE